MVRRATVTAIAAEVVGRRCETRQQIREAARATVYRVESPTLDEGRQAQGQLTSDKSTTSGKRKNNAGKKHRTNKSCNSVIGVKEELSCSRGKIP